MKPTLNHPSCGLTSPPVKKTTKKPIVVFRLAAILAIIVVVSSSFKSVYNHHVFLAKEANMIISPTHDHKRAAVVAFTPAIIHKEKEAPAKIEIPADKTVKENLSVTDAGKYKSRDTKSLSFKSTRYHKLKKGFMPSAFERNTISLNVVKMEKVLKVLNNTVDMVEVGFNSNAVKSAAYEKAVGKYAESWDGVGKVVIIGFTDNWGSSAYNILLGLKRAEKMKAYLISTGLPAEKITTVSFGAKYPVADNNTTIGRAKNRRVEINIMH